MVKSVSSGLQCEVIDENGTVSIVNCRWDMCDRYFAKRNLKSAQVLNSVRFSPEDVTPLLKDQMLLTIHDKPEEHPLILEIASLEITSEGGN